MSIIPNNNELNEKKVVYPLKEIEKRKIVEHNDLITSVAKMDKVPLKIFELAVSCIDTDNPPKDHTILLSKTELFAFLKYLTTTSMVALKKPLKKCKSKLFFRLKKLREKVIT
ncbi:RepB family plasmid replication initiator protein [Enterococcus faecalis]|nr:RepB family plasmid replication initiator protein [Enterococcus faecalis]MDH4720569.1 RepB family plasmid replication initiator protein [Enterococcus faecalis]